MCPSFKLTDKTILMKDSDGNLVECEILSSRLKESIFQKSVPFLPAAFAGLLFFLNICPGLGTFIGALTVVFGAKTSFEKKEKVQVTLYFIYSTNTGRVREP